MSEYFNGQFVMMPVKVIDKECMNCELLDIKTGGSPIYDGENNKRVGYENTMRCCSLYECLRYYNRIAKKVQKTETEPETVEAEIEGGGSTWWYVCEDCRTAIDSRDKYCRECGRRIKWTEVKK